MPAVLCELGPPAVVALQPHGGCDQPGGAGVYKRDQDAESQQPQAPVDRIAGRDERPAEQRPESGQLRREREAERRGRTEGQSVERLAVTAAKHVERQWTGEHEQLTDDRDRDRLEREGTTAVAGEI